MAIIVITKRIEITVITKSMVIWWMMSFLICQVIEGGRNGHVPAMFVFGDSLADAGTNNFLPNCSARADFTPYGVSFFPSPTGRFTNGRTVFDFIATYLKLPFLPPYHEWANFSGGVNFASGGSGLLDLTGVHKKIVKLSDQISRFEEFSRRELNKSYLSNSLYCITRGGNDIDDYFNGIYSNLNTTQFVTLLVETLDLYIVRLYHAGARKFLIFDISAVGCTPIARFRYYIKFQGECAEPGNKLALEYNAALRKHVDHLNEELHEVNIILLNSYHYMTVMIKHGEDFGFSDTKSACCGSGLLNADVSCGMTTPTDLYCKNADKYLFWDAIHPTERVYSIFSKEIWRGNSSVMHPFNLSTLILGRKT